MSCLGVPPTRDQQNSPPPFQRLQSVKKMSCFIFVCLRSVHSLLSFRFGGRSSYLTHVHPSLHCAQFISPTSAPHGISGFFIPLHKSTQSFHFAYRLYSSHKYIHTQTASKAPFHSPTHCFVPFSRHPCPFPTHFQWCIFSHCDESTPLSTFQVER